ncbi:MAG: phosphate acyltransferase PlsX, partial [Burkholderiales bacterium]
MDVSVAVDAMGGDHGPHVTVPAALQLLRRHSDYNVVLVGLSDAIEAEFKAHKATPGPRIRIH